MREGQFLWNPVSKDLLQKGMLTITIPQVC